MLLALLGGSITAWAQMSNLYQLPSNNTVVYDVAQTPSGKFLLATGADGLWLWSPDGNVLSKIYNDPVLFIEPWNNQFLIGFYGTLTLIDTAGNLSPLNTNGYLVNSLITDFALESDSTFFALLLNGGAGSAYHLYHYSPSSGFTPLNKTGWGIAFYKGLLHLAGSRTTTFEVFNGTNWWPQNSPTKGRSSRYLARLIPVDSTQQMYVLSESGRLYLYDGDTLHDVANSERVSKNTVGGRAIRKNIFLHQNQLYTTTERGIQIVDSMSVIQLHNQNNTSTSLLYIQNNGYWAFSLIPSQGNPTRTWMEMGILDKEAHDRSQTLLKNPKWELPLLSTGNIGQSLDSSYAVQYKNKRIYMDSHLYMGALVNGVPRTVVEDYRGYNGFGYSSGPISNQYDADYLRRYTRVWTVKRADIEHHKNNFNKPGYIASGAIVSWPGNGRAQFAENQMLAPFVDLNGNGRYEPKLGEYPEIKGDQMAFMIFNDTRNPKINSGAEPLGAEVHLSVYLFDSTKSADLQNSVFFNYKIFNRSAEEWAELTLGFPWVYFMGANDEGMIFSDSLRPMVGVVKDQPFDTSGVNGWGAFPPALVFRGLSAPIDGANLFSSSLISISGGYPKTNSDAWNYLNYRYKDGTQHARWYNEIMRPRNPWFAATQLRGLYILPTISLGTVHPGAFACFDYSFSLDNDSVGVFADFLAPFYAAQNRSDAVQSFFDANNLRCFSQAISVTDLSGEMQSVVVYPNPTEAGNVLHLSGLSNPQALFLTNVLGQTISLSHQKIGAKLYAIQLPHQLAPGIYFLTVEGASTFQTKIQVL